MAAEYADKTESPTPRRRTEARERGQVARSVELSAALMLLASIVILKLAGPWILHGLFLVLHDGLSAEGTPAEFLANLARWKFRLVAGIAAATLPLMLALAVVAFASSFIQVGPLASWHPLRPQLSKINPLAGLGRVFSTRSAAQLVVNLLKLVLIGMIAYDSLRADAPRILAAIELDDRQLLAVAADLCYWLGLKLAALLLLLALLDFAYRRWQHERDLRMTKDELREELRRMEGDPVLRQRRRRIQLEMAIQRLRRDVPKADVVVTNPTELAVALRYQEKTMRAPVVLAKGAGVLARRIRELAAAHRIPIIERKPLAQALYKAVEVGQEIPSQFYKAVAEILAYVYELSGRRRKATA